MTPSRWLPPGLVVVVTLAAFLPTLGNGFAPWDDALNFLDNPWHCGLGPAPLNVHYLPRLLPHAPGPAPATTPAALRWGAAFTALVFAVHPLRSAC